jgi:hypothetical protein
LPKGTGARAPPRTAEPPVARRLPHRPTDAPWVAMLAVDLVKRDLAALHRVQFPLLLASQGVTVYLMKRFQGFH